MAKTVQRKNTNGGSDGSSASPATGSSQASSNVNGNAAPLSEEESAAKLRALGFGGSQTLDSVPSTELDEKVNDRVSKDDSIDSSGSGAEDGQAPAYSGLRRRLLSPFEIHYSQSHIRPEFQDGRIIEETAQSIPKLLVTTPSDMDAESIGMPQPKRENGNQGWWLLQPPFPEIEVIQWRCKLRRADGTIMTDENGMELYGDTQWFTLDNRRLYCLQQMAAQLHPAEVRCAVITIRQEDGNYREFRKFRTPDLGRTVGIGHRDSGVLPRWSWRKEVGLPELPAPVGTPIMSKKPQKRGPARGPNNGRGRWKNNHDEDEDEDGRWDPIHNVLFFIFIYAVLRIVFHVGKHFWNANAGAGGAAVTSASVPDIGSPNPI